MKPNTKGYCTKRGYHIDCKPKEEAGSWEKENKTEDKDVKQFIQEEIEKAFQRGLDAQSSIQQSTTTQWEDIKKGIQKEVLEAVEEWLFEDKRDWDVFKKKILKGDI